jgi:hypothetical protein
MTVERLIALYEQGLITEGEFFPGVGHLVTPENVDDVLGKLSPGLLEGVRIWAFRTPLGEGVILGSGLSQQQAIRIASQLEQSVPVIRAWFQAKGANQERPCATA